MTRTLPAALALCLAALPAAAEPVSMVAPAVVDQTTAFIDAFGVAIDLDGDHRISAREMDLAGNDIFASMDVDGDGFLTAPEMTGWEHGFGELALFRGRRVEFETAVTDVFDLMDSDGDGRVDPAEHARGLDLARRLGDRDGDGMLSLTEFREDFLVVTALRRGVGSDAGY